MLPTVQAPYIFSEYQDNTAYQFSFLSDLLQTNVNDICYPLSLPADIKLMPPISGAGHKKLHLTLMQPAIAHDKLLV